MHQSRTSCPARWLVALTILCLLAGLAPAPVALVAPAVAAPTYALTLSAGGGGGVIATPNKPLYEPGEVVTLTATPSAGHVLIQWTIDGAPAGWANPKPITMDADHAVVATFAPRPAFGDVPPGGAAHDYVTQLAARGIIKGYSPGECAARGLAHPCFGPADPIVRAQVAALIVRSFGWDAENPGGPAPFSDLGGIDPELQRAVAILAARGIINGYGDTTFGPVDQVLHIQVVSFVTRALVQAGHWQPVTADNPAIYPNVPLSSGHRLDLLTFVANAGPIAARPPGQAWADWDTPASRAWTARGLWQALDSFFGGVGPGPSGSPSPSGSPGVSPSPGPSASPSPSGSPAPTNRAPVAAGDSYSTPEDVPLVVPTPGVLGNDTDADGDALTAAVVTSPANGTLTLNANGSFTYTPNAGYNGGDSFTYRANDGAADSAAATVSIAVGAVDDAPVAAGQAVTTPEDTARTITLAATDGDSPALTFAIVAAPANGTLGPVGAPVCTPSGAGSSCTATVTYTPAADYAGPDAFTFRANDGVADSVAATVGVTVTAVNDAPAAADDSYTTAEDTALAPAIPGVLGNDTDPDAGTTLTAVLVSGPANAASFILNADGSFSYTPAADYNGTDSFTYQANDGTAASGTTTVSITVTAVNDAPVASGQTPTTPEDTAATLTLSATDNDSPALTFAIATGPVNGTLGALGTPSCATVAGLTTCTVTVDYTPNPNYNGPDSFTFTATDGGATSAPATVSLTVSAVTDVPTADAQSVTTTEDTALPITLSGSAGDSTSLTFAVVTGPTGGALGAIGTPSCTTTAGVTTCTASVTYTPSANANGPDSFTFRVNDGTTDSAAATVGITVTAVNDAPSFTKGADQTVNEDAGAQTVNGWAVALSAGPADEGGQALTFEVTENTNASLFTIGPAVSSAGVLTYTPAADANGVATITIQLRDNGGTANGGVDVSGTQSFTITVTAINDPPTFTVNDPPAALEDSGAQAVANVATSISTGPANEAGQTLTGFAVTDNTNPGLFSVAPALSTDGTLTYTPAANAFGTATITVTLQDNGGAANGGVDTSLPQQFTITVTGVNDAPSFTLAGNPAASDEDAGAQSVASFATAISAGPGESGQTLTFNLTVTGTTGGLTFTTAPAINPATGALTYTAAPDANGTATVSVTLGDNGGTANGGADTSGAQSFTITVTAINDPPSVTTTRGFTARAHLSLAIADTTTQSGHLLVGASDKANEPSALSVRGVGNVAPPTTTAQGGSLAIAADGTFTYTSPPGFVSAGAINDSFQYVVCDDGVPLPGACSATVTVTLTVEGPVVWFIDDSATTGGNGTLARPFNSVGAFNSTAADEANDAIFLFAGTYTEGFTLLNGQQLIGEGATGTGLGALLGAGTPPAGSAAYPAIGGAAPSITTTAASTNGVTLGSGNTLRGFNLGNATGVALSGANFGTLVVAEVGISTNGQALGLTTGTLSGSFTGLTSRGGTNNVLLSGVSTSGTSGLGTNADSLSGATGDALKIDGGGGSFTYAGTIGNTSTLAVNIANKTGGTVTLSGSINPSAAGRGIAVSGNNTGTNTIVFSGAAQQINPGAGAAVGVNLTNNTGSTISFTGGALAITTDDGNGFNATGGGTVIVTGASNTIVSTGGIALNVANTTIGAGGLNFRSIAANGGANGIVLSNTGSAAGLTVSGNGGACTTAVPTCSGGTIQNTAGADGTTAGIGVFLNETRHVSLAFMRVSDHQNFAVRGTSVAGLTLANSIISGTNGTNADVDEASVAFDGLTGSASFTDVSVSGGVEDNIRVRNTSGTLDRIVFTRLTVGANSTATGGDGLILVPDGTATMRATVQNSTFTSARGDLFQLDVKGTATADLIFSGNTLSNNHPNIVSGGGGVTIAGGGLGSAMTLTYSVSNSTFRDAVGHGLLVSKAGGAGAMSGTISGNQIGVAGAANSGSRGGSGLAVLVIGGGTHSVTISGNQIRQYNNHGILLQAGDNTQGGHGTLNATVTGNTVANPGSLATLAGNGIHLNAGTLDVPLDQHQVCAQIGGAGALANVIAGSGVLGGTDFRLRQRQQTTVRLPGYTGANNNDAAVISFVQANNGGAPSGTASNTVSGGGGGFVGGAPCATTATSGPASAGVLPARAVGGLALVVPMRAGGAWRPEEDGIV